MAEERKIIFHGELQMTRWAESSTNGATVTFWVHPEDLESFKLLKARTGKTAGARIAAAMTLIGEDEQVVEHPAPAQESKPRPQHRPNIGEFGMVAVRWCRDRDFWRWANSTGSTIDVEDEASAKEFILMETGVVDRYGAQASRKHLDADPDCNRAFNERIRIPFRDWLIEQGIEK
jgi:hypothetical protein